MPNNLSTGIKGVLLVVGASIVTVGAAILIIVISIMFLIDTHKCSALGPSLLALLGTTAVVFLISGIVVGVIAWKIIPSIVGRLVIVAVHAVSLLVTYIGIAFGLLVAFNC
jgi:hypothetical protein